MSHRCKSERRRPPGAFVLAGDNAGRWPDLRVRPRRAPLAVVFSDPQIMLAGASHAELTAAGTAFAIGTVSFGDQGRSRVMLQNRGHLRVYADRDSGRLLGAEGVGPVVHRSHLGWHEVPAGRRLLGFDPGCRCHAPVVPGVHEVGKGP